MNRVKPLFRALAALVAALALLGFSAGAGMAQVAEPVTIRIHKATCPATTGVDIFEKCHDNALPDIAFVITSDFEVVAAGEEIATVTTGDNGRASRQVPAGAITITEDEADFAEFVGARVYCSVLGTDEVLFDARAEDDGSVTFDAEAGQEVICDWYDLTGAANATATATSAPTVEPTADPGDELATVRIHKASCPANTQGNIFEACHDNALPGITFDINGELITTGATGRLSRSFDPGEITITEDATDAADYTSGRVICTEQGSQDVLVDESTDAQMVSFEAAAGDEVICDWYNIEGGDDATATGTVSATVPAATATTGGGGAVATATSEAGSATTLPGTGAGASGGTSNALLLVVALLLSVVGGAFILRKQQLT